MGTAGELVTGRTRGVASAEDALDRCHPVVTPEVFRRRDVLRPTDPRSRRPRVRTDKIGLAGHDLRTLALGLNVLGGPEDCLGYRHVEKITPGFRFYFFHF